MTAEIGILNREAVALAADSAVTSGSKIFPSANKIFTLSKNEPIGIMVYGSATFMAVPWETVVKEYRRQLGAGAYGTLQEYAEDFLKYLHRETRFAPVTEQRGQVYRLIAEEFADLRNDVDRLLEAVFDAGQPVPEDLVKRVVDGLVNGRFQIWKQAPYPDHFPAKLRQDIRKKYSTDISAAKKHFFPDLLTAAASKRLTEIAVNVITKMADQRGQSSGVVIAGFGADEIYPQLLEYRIQGVVEGNLKYRTGRSTSIDPAGERAAVMAFAQGEMVSLFMEGIDPAYKRVIEEFLREVVTGYPKAISERIESAIGQEEARDLLDGMQKISERLISQYDQELEQRRREMYIDPIVSVIGMLPKGELASAAETLVNLTSFKRRVSRQAETVGGPIDVAVITKGDGFIWIKRKHYFDPRLNHHFFANYFPRQELQGERQEED